MPSHTWGNSTGAASIRLCKRHPNIHSFWGNIWRWKKIGCFAGCIPQNSKYILRGICKLTKRQKAFEFISHCVLYQLIFFPLIWLWISTTFQVRKEMLLSPEELSPFQNHSTQMAALDYLVSVASDVFIPSNDGNMAKVVEGHRRLVAHHRVQVIVYMWKLPSVNTSILLPHTFMKPK